MLPTLLYTADNHYVYIAGETRHDGYRHYEVPATLVSIIASNDVALSISYKRNGHKPMHDIAVLERVRNAQGFGTTLLPDPGISAI